VSASSHEFFDHTSELGLRILAPTFADVLAEATRALAELMLRGQALSAEGPWRSLVVRATDREALLVDWLNELVFYAETERWVAVEVDVKIAGDTKVTAMARGASVADAPSLVKAVTHHRLSVREEDCGLVAEVVLDV
jgi:SHS2 domain-containing protein